MTVLRCRWTTHAVGTERGVITRHCRDCSRHAADPAARVYHRWRFDGLRWLALPDLVRRGPRDRS